MLQALKKYFFRKELSKISTKQRDKGINRLQSVGVIGHLENVDQLEGLREFSRMLHKRGISTTGVATISKSLALQEAISDINVITEKDTNWIGVPTKEAYADFLKSHNDLLIAINTDQRPTLHYLLKSGQADLKAGVLHCEEWHADYDFLLDAGRETALAKLLRAVFNQITHLQ